MVSAIRENIPEPFFITKYDPHCRYCRPPANGLPHRHYEID